MRIKCKKRLGATILSLLFILLIPATSAQSSSEDSQDQQISIEELQQLLERFNPALLQQMFDSLNLKTEELGQEAENYLQCLEQQQAISQSEPMDLSRFISEALTTGKVCQFLLDDLVNKMHSDDQNPDEEQQKELIEKSL